MSHGEDRLERVGARLRPLALADLVDDLTALGQDDRRPVVVAVDGTSGSGKSTLAARIVERVEGSALLATDDLAWHEPLFAWEHLLRDDVLSPLRRGDGIAFTPPAWTRMGRAGSIDLPAGLRLLVVEGVGASQVAVADLLDAAIWVHTDEAEARRRGIERDVASGVNGDAEEAVRFWDAWDEAERAFLQRDRPWERANVVVAGSAHGHDDDTVLALRGPLGPLDD